ncbi:MAG: VWA domain-containing protein [Lentimicrobiaceae bacterium]|nr:VWA domain-containing protein [Lentimicrobiaceae bacterium]
MLKKTIKYSVAVVLFLTLFSTNTHSQTVENIEKTKPVTRILFIFDASQSMLGRWQSDSKFNIARKLMYELLDSIKGVPNTQIALRLYGHQYQFPPQVCNDTKLEVPFGNNNIERIKQKLQSSKARGTTPLSFAMEQAVKDFADDENSRNIIILITDGIEECNGDPCAVSAMLQKNGIALKPFIIGIGNDFNEAFDCVGTYFDATKEEDFKKALNVIISQTLNSTTAQVNLLDINEKPTETNVGITFYDQVSGRIVYNFIHTFNNRGLPDTIVIDPLITYRVVAHTTPPVQIENVTITPGKHNIIALDTPQGKLKLKMNTSNLYTQNLNYAISHTNDCKPLLINNFEREHNFIVGDYDIEIFTLPKIEIKDINIAQSSTTTIEIPEPGILVLRKNYQGSGIIQSYSNDVLTNIYTLKNSLTLETLYMQPGKYRVIFRPQNSKSTIYNVEKVFTISSGKTTDIQLY